MYIFAVTGIPLFKEQTQYDAQNLTYGKSFEGISNSFSTIFRLLTIDHWYSLLEDGWKVPELNKVACGAFVISWIIVGSFIFRHLFVGFMLKLQGSQKDSHDITQLPEVEQVVLPRDTLFRYFELMEELQRNLEEKKRLHHLKNPADAPGNEQEELAEEGMKSLTCCGTLSKKETLHSWDLVLQPPGGDHVYRFFCIHENYV
ncbi:hypothetical protein SRHO_G00151640 [Serrasalmus rhombeus]